MKILHKFFDKDILALLGHAKNYLSVDVFGNALALLTVPIFTRILSPTDYGIIYIFSSFVSVLSIILSLGLRGAIKVNYVNKKYPHAEYLASNLIFLLLVNLFFIIGLILTKNIISETFNVIPFVFVLAVINSFLGIFPEIYLNLLQIKQESKRYAHISIFKNFTNTLVSIVVILLMSTNLYLGKIYTTLGVSFLVFIYTFYFLIKQSKLSFSMLYVRDALAYSLPLIPHLLSGFILAFFDRIVINQLVSSAAAGIYSLAYQFGIVMNMIVMNMTKAWQPIYWQMIKEKNWSKVNKLAHKYAKYVYMCGLGLILFSREVVLIFVDKAYFEAISILPIIIFSYIFVFLYTLFVGYTIYARKTGLISFNTLLAGFVNIALNYYFIPRYGYFAAAYTTLVSYFLLFLLHYCSVRYILKFDKLKLNAVLPDFLFLILILCIFFGFNLWIINSVTLFIIKVVLFGVSFYFYFKINNQKVIK